MWQLKKKMRSFTPYLYAKEEYINLTNQICISLSNNILWDEPNTNNQTININLGFTKDYHLSLFDNLLFTKNRREKKELEWNKRKKSKKWNDARKLGNCDDYIANKINPLHEELFFYIGLMHDPKYL